MYGTSTTTVPVLLIIGCLTLCTTYTTGVSASEDAINKTERANLTSAQKNRAAVIEFEAADGKPLTSAEYREVRLAILRALNRRKHGTTTQVITTVPTSSETLPPQTSTTTEPPTTLTIQDDTTPKVSSELEPKRRRRDAPNLEPYKEDALEFVNMVPEVEGNVFRMAVYGTGEGADEIPFDELFAAIEEVHKSRELEEAAGNKPVVTYYRLPDLPITPDPVTDGLVLWITIPICLLLLLLLLLLLICCLCRKKNRRQKQKLPKAVIEPCSLRPKTETSALPLEYPNGLPAHTRAIIDDDGWIVPLDQFCDEDERSIEPVRF